ncbi:hypothetical protein C8J57DRAFT_1633794 [Mycena rebaudengoi]|nr:hypothetical protein C8J57DRAFT_1633794 [Mycena rebaudengoi]
MDPPVTGIDEQEPSTSVLRGQSSPTPALRSRGGRPKGSRNKKTAEKPVDDAPPKPRGRPRGSGPLQKVRAAAEAAGESTEETKRPVGRPPKHPTQPFSVHMGRRTVPGMPVVIHSKNSTNTPASLHSIFAQPSSSAPSPVLHPLPSASASVPSTRFNTPTTEASPFLDPPEDTDENDE